VPKEADLWQTLKLAMTRYLRMQRVESPTTPGLPDVYYRRGSACGWIELKRLLEWPARPATPVHVPSLTGKQVGWLRAETKAGGAAHMLIQIADDYLLLDSDAVMDLFRRELTKADLLSRAQVVGHKEFPTLALLRFLTTKSTSYTNTY
jgi:hypothetical protein